MRDTLHTKGIDVRFADNPVSPVPALLRELLVLPDSTPEASRVDLFVASSRTAAEHLYQTQTGQNSTGLLTFIRGQVDDQPCIGILKLQKEEGARFQLQEIEGHRTFTLERMRQLMLTDSTRVFKASLFRLAEPASETAVGIVSDEQRSYFARREIADFFLGRFLGCRPTEDPDTTTKEVFYATEDFINTRISDPGTMANYQLALLSEMNSQRGQFDPVRFASDHFAAEHRQPYLQHLRQQNLPDHTFDKGAFDALPNVKDVELLHVQQDVTWRGVRGVQQGKADSWPCHRGTMIFLGQTELLLWTQGNAPSVAARGNYFKEGKGIPSPLLLTRYSGHGPAERLATECWD